MGEKLAINVGDKLVIQAQGVKVEGEVYSVNHYGERDGWYIEMKNANVNGGYSYWKQGYDGGRILSVNGKEVDDKNYTPRYE